MRGCTNYASRLNAPLPGRTNSSVCCCALRPHRFVISGSNSSPSHSSISESFVEAETCNQFVMRPQKLTLKNFMPFRSADGQVHEVDFSNLDLFAITGPMASGKSALIDAIVWCLYGRTARYGADSKGVISAGESACEVWLDFTIGPRWFRAVRRTGKTTESGLSELEGGEWVQDTSGSELLTKRIEALLGLDFASFTKTVILPQGSYAEFLLSESGKRRDLLAKILELGVYSRVAERAKNVAA